MSHWCGEARFRRTVIQCVRNGRLRWGTGTLDTGDASRYMPVCSIARLTPRSSVQLWGKMTNSSRLIPLDLSFLPVIRQVDAYRKLKPPSTHPQCRTTQTAARTLGSASAKPASTAAGKRSAAGARNPSAPFAAALRSHACTSRMGAASPGARRCFLQMMMRYLRSRFW